MGTYDWSEGGDTEVVVEDIERMDMDYHDKYDRQQLDWRMLTEDNFGQARLNYTGEQKHRILGGFCTGWHFADDIILTSDEALEAEQVRSRLPGSKYTKGFNVSMGDPDPFFGILQTGKSIPKTTRKHYFKLRDLMMCEILRPNLIVYLDAPVDVVQREIRERAEKTHPWEKNSPVYENTGYLNHLYNDLFKKQYLQEAGIHSYVLSYDWSEGGDTEVVVEDIERMDMDYHDKYDRQQLDWRMLTEDNFGQARLNYTGEQKHRILGGFCTGWHFADDIILTSDEALEAEQVRSRLPGSKYTKGFNVSMGDPDPFFGILQTGKSIPEMMYEDSLIKPENTMDNNALAYGDSVREKARAEGDKDWWKKGWETWTPHLAESKSSFA